MRRSLKLPAELCEGSCKISAGFRLVFSCFAALEKDVRSFSKGFHKLPWHHGFPQRYFKLWNLSHDAVGARPDRQDASGAVCRAALQRCQVRLWRWMLMAQGESEVTAGLTQLYFSAGVGPSRFSICAPGLCAGNCSEARFWVRFCVQKSRPLVRGLPGARFYYVDHFRKKAACGGSLFFKKKILHARSLPVGQSCCSVAIWGAQGLEKCRFSDTKIGAARRPQFWGRSSSLFMYLHIIIREAGCISWPHFWGRETAPFLGPQV